MSPLATVIMKVLRWGVLGIAGFLGLVLVLEAWKHGWDLRALNPRFMAVVGLLAIGALWLARSIGRELAKHGS
jgi:apolipoprotein N-acyltransferase